jgi:hypothetical protein
MNGDLTERPEDTVRRFAQEIDELKSWQQCYREAAALWDVLDLQDGDSVECALLIGKVVNFEKGGPPQISLAVTDGVDWINETGLLHAALDIKASQPFSQPE